MRESPKKPSCFAMRSRWRDNFYIAQFFLKLVWQNGENEKDTNPTVAGRRKQTKERAAEQMCIDNIPMGLNESNDFSVSDIIRRIFFNITVIAV